MNELGFKGDLLKHGIRREVFISLLADNSIALLKNGIGKPQLCSLQSADQVGRIARERWIVPRARSRPEYRTWNREDILLSIRSAVTSGQTEYHKVAYPELIATVYPLLIAAPISTNKIYLDFF
jgi:hypothetical protein